MKINEVTKTIFTGIAISLLILTFVFTIVALPFVIESHSTIQKMGIQYNNIVNKIIEEKESEKEEQDNIAINAFKHISPDVVVHEKTGVIYFYDNCRGVITTPLFNKDGTVMIDQGENK